MKTKLQFRIATLLWLTVSVAAFFAGRHWDQITTAVRQKPRVIYNANYQILAGSTGLFEANMPVTRMTIADPTIATITPETQSTLLVTAKRAGTTKIQLWSESTNETATFEVTVK
jgi:Flp pilus assembly secretin CpaC